MGKRLDTVYAETYEEAITTAKQYVNDDVVVFSDRGIIFVKKEDGTCIDPKELLEFSNYMDFIDNINVHIQRLMELGTPTECTFRLWELDGILMAVLSHPDWGNLEVSLLIDPTLTKHRFTRVGKLSEDKQKEFYKIVVSLIEYLSGSRFLVNSIKIKGIFSKRKFSSLVVTSSGFEIEMEV